MQVAQSVPETRKDAAAESAFAVAQFQHFGGQVQVIPPRGVKRRKKAYNFKCDPKMIPESYKPKSK